MCLSYNSSISDWISKQLLILSISQNWQSLMLVMSSIRPIGMTAVMSVSAVISSD